MTRNTSKTTISDDGLRFVSRTNGAPFTSPGSSSGPGATMSCFLCGAHWPRSDGQWRKFLGKHHFICSPCGEARSPKATPAAAQKGAVTTK